MEKDQEAKHLEQTSAGVSVRDAVFPGASEPKLQATDPLNRGVKSLTAPLVRLYTTSRAIKGSIVA